MQICDLSCEYRKAPLGMDVQVPRFAWKLKESGRNTVQKSYRIVVEKVDGGQTMWDSHKVDSHQSHQVEYQGRALDAMTAYRWRVTVDTNRDSAVSDWAVFETGLMDFHRWEAKWIGYGEPCMDMSRLPIFRNTFSLAQGKKIARARVYASALGIYRLRLNGQAVSEDWFTPGWTVYRDRIQYQTYDVTELLQDGPNCMGIMLGDGWYHSEVTRHHIQRNDGDQIAALAQLVITYQDGSQQIVITDEGWKAAQGPVITSDFYKGETQDSRLEQTGWDTADFDDSAWDHALCVEHPYDTLISQEGIPARVVKELKPQAILTTPAGETVLDMGQNMVGVMRFTVTGEAGHTLSIRHAEVLDKEGNFYTANLRSADPHFTVTLKGGTEACMPLFNYMGFRYVRLENWPCEVRAEDFTGLVICSDLERTGDFSCSNEKINRLYQNVVWGQMGNFVDVPTDCPQRDERLGWTGDAQVFIRTACFNMQSAPFFTKWLHDVKADQREDGAVPFVVPNVLGEKNCGSSAWGDAAAICPWTLYQCYGDKRILEQQFSSMKAWVEYIRNTGEERNLWNTGFQFGDWLALDAAPKAGKENYTGVTDVYFIASVFYLASVELTLKTAKLLGLTKEIKRYEKMHAKVLKHIQKEYITPNGRLAVPTQTALALALRFGVMPEEFVQRTVDDLAKLIEANEFHLNTGFVGTPYLCNVLTEHGRHDLACRIFLQEDYPSWLYAVNKGATTIWEHWDGIRTDGSFWDTNMNSYNHYAYGCIAEWMTRHAVGLDLDDADPAYHHSILHPRFIPDMDWAQASLETQYGRLSLRWENQGEDRILHIEVPANTHATLLLDQYLPDEIRENDRSIRLATGIREAALTEDGCRIELGSGVYDLVCEG